MAFKLLNDFLFVSDGNLVIMSYQLLKIPALNKTATRIYGYFFSGKKKIKVENIRNSDV